MGYVVAADVRIKLAKLLRELETKVQETALIAVESEPQDGHREHCDRLLDDIARLRRAYQEAH